MHRFALNVGGGGRFGGGGGGGGGGGRFAAPPPPVRDACTPPEGAAPPTQQRRRAGGGGGGRQAPVVLQPGEYTVRLSVDGQTYTQTTTVKPDPRGVPVDHANPEGPEGM